MEKRQKEWTLWELNPRPFTDILICEATARLLEVKESNGWGQLTNHTPSLVDVSES